MPLPMFERAALAAPPHPHPATPAQHSRPSATHFLTGAQAGRAQTALPPFRDGDSVSCPLGTEWVRHNGQWTVPGQPRGLALSDRIVTLWARQPQPGSQFALVHRLTTTETHLITGDHYTSYSHNHSARYGAFTYQEPVTGDWLREMATQATLTRTISAHLELPSKIVTLHSRHYGDIFFHPSTNPATTHHA